MFKRNALLIMVVMVLLSSISVYYFIRKINTESMKYPELQLQATKAVVMLAAEPGMDKNTIARSETPQGEPQISFTAQRYVQFTISQDKDSAVPKDDYFLVGTTHIPVKGDIRDKMREPDFVTKYCHYSFTYLFKSEEDLKVQLNKLVKDSQRPCNVLPHQRPWE